MASPAEGDAAWVCPVAFAAWLGVHGMPLTGIRNKIDAFMAWGWGYFSKDRATAMVDRPDATRIEWGMTTTENSLSSRRIRTEQKHPELP
jgi:NADH:quinone reductase (non-electrogenic)